MGGGYRPRIEKCPDSMRYAAFCDDHTQCYNTDIQGCDGREHCADGSDERCGIFSYQVKVALVIVVAVIFFGSTMLAICKHCYGKRRSPSRQRAGSDSTRDREPPLGPSGRYAWYLAPNSAQRNTSPDVTDHDEVSQPITTPSREQPEPIARGSSQDLRPQTSYIRGPGQGRSWYDMSDGSHVTSQDPPTQARAGNLGNMRPVSTRSWYDVSDRTSDSRSWHDGNRPVLNGPVSSHSWYDVSDTTGRTLYNTAHTDVSAALLSERHRSPPPSYREVVSQPTSSGEGEEPPPTYQDVLNRESSI